MLRIKKHLSLTLTIFILLSIFTASFVVAEDGEIRDEFSGIAYQLTEVRDEFYNNGDLEVIKEKLYLVQQELTDMPAGVEKYYYLGQADFLLAEIAESKGNKRAAVTLFNRSGEYASKAKETNNKYSAAYRLQADVYFSLMNYNGFEYQMSKGPLALSLLTKAIELDGKNYAAYNSLGSYYLNAPKIGGGSFEKGVTMLEQGLVSEGKYDQFYANICLATAYHDKKDQVKALQYAEKALEIYPENSWALRVYQDIGSE